MLYSPRAIAFAGIVVWAVLWILSPLEVVGYLDPTALIFVVLCYAAFMIGCAYARHILHSGPAGQVGGAVPETAPAHWAIPFQPTFFWTTTTIGLFGMALRVIDRTIYRGVEYGANALEFRETLTNATASPLAAFASVIFPFCFIPLILLLASWRHRRRPALLILAIAIFSLPMAESLFQLSRSIMLQTLGIGFAAIVVLFFRGNPFNRKLLLVSTASLVALAIISSIIFSYRLGLSERRLSDSVFESVYADNLQPNRKASEALLSGDPLEAGIYNAILPNSMYFLSGIYEFSYLWNRPDPQPHSVGLLLFYPFVKAFTILAAPDALDDFDEDNLVYKVGVFQSFFGPLWIDFGWFGIVFMAIFGLFCQIMSSYVRRGSINILPLYLYFTVVIFSMPVVSFLISGFGTYIITSFMLFAMFVGRAAVRGDSFRQQRVTSP